MANERRGSADTPPAGGGRKKRPAPTIDLSPEEIGTEAPQEPPEASAQPAPEAASPEPPRQPGEAARAAAELRREAEEAAAEEEVAETNNPAGPLGTTYERKSELDFSGWIPAMPENIPWTSIGAGALGAFVMLVGLWLLGVFADDDGSRVVENRVLRMEGQLRDLARVQGQQPGQPAADPRRIEELALRVARLEATPSAPLSPPGPGQPQAADPALENRLGAAEEILKALDQNLTDLHRRGEEFNTALREMRERAESNSTIVADLARRTAQQGTAGRSEVDALGNRIAAAESASRSLQADIAKLASGSPDRASRLAITASGLRAAVERGDPFAAELASVKALGADARALAPLEPFAQAGVPSAVALGREFAAVSTELTRAAGATAGQGGGFLDRLQANAEKLVRVRPVDEAPGDDPRAVVSRADARANEGNLAAILAELAKLAPAARAPAEPWIRKVEARAAAIDAGRRVAADALAAFAKSDR